jgi:hypothetical protein
MVFFPYSIYVYNRGCWIAKPTIIGEMTKAAALNPLVRLNADLSRRLISLTNRLIRDILYLSSYLSSCLSTHRRFRFSHLSLWVTSPGSLIALNNLVSKCAFISFIVFVQAIVLSFESIVEFLTEIHGISSLLVAGIGIPLAGITLLFISTVLSKKITVFKSWKPLLVASIFLAAAVFLWYDSVTRVGASKEGLLA